MDVSTYTQMVWSLERAHHAFLDLVRQELERAQIHDINNVQALMIYHLGDGELTVGEIGRRGYYLGSNVSYNLKMLVARGYVEQRRSEMDRRTVHIKLSEKGRKLRDYIRGLFAHHSTQISDEIKGIGDLLSQLDKFWENVIHIRPPTPELPSGPRPPRLRSRA